MDFGREMWLSCNIRTMDTNDQGNAASMSEIATSEREFGSAFLPKFDSQGLLTAIAVDRDSREILMVAFMDAEALARTRESGLAHF